MSKSGDKWDMLTEELGACQGRERMDLAAAKYFIPSFQNYLDPFLSLDICHQSGWHVTEETHRWPVDICKMKIYFFLIFHLPPCSQHGIFFFSTGGGCGRLHAIAWSEIGLCGKLVFEIFPSILDESLPFHLCSFLQSIRHS